MANETTSIIAVGSWGAFPDYPDRNQVMQGVTYGNSKYTGVLDIDTSGGEVWSEAPPERWTED